MNEDVILYLPWPPTVNSYYKVARSGVRYLDKNVGIFRDRIAESISEQCPGLYLDEPIFMEVYLFPPDKRKRDLDNYMKGLLDALTEAGLWEDDSLIHQLHIYRGARVDGGQVKVEISEAGPILGFE